MYIETSQKTITKKGKVSFAFEIRPSGWMIVTIYLSSLL